MAAANEDSFDLICGDDSEEFAQANAVKAAEAVN